MTSQLQPQRLIRWLAASAAAIGLAAPAAMAIPADPTTPQSSAHQAKANVYVPPAAAFTDTVTRSANANVYVPPAIVQGTQVGPATGDGFDWGAAAIGAAVIAALALVAAGGFLAAQRARVRLAR